MLMEGVVSRMVTTGAVLVLRDGLLISSVESQNIMPVLRFLRVRTEPVVLYLCLISRDLNCSVTALQVCVCVCECYLPLTLPLHFPQGLPVPIALRHTVTATHVKMAAHAQTWTPLTTAPVLSTTLVRTVKLIRVYQTSVVTEAHVHQRAHNRHTLQTVLALLGSKATTVRMMWMSVLWIIPAAMVPPVSTRMEDSTVTALLALRDPHVRAVSTIVLLTPVLMVVLASMV